MVVSRRCNRSINRISGKFTKKIKENKEKFYNPLLKRIENNHKEITNMDMCLPEFIEEDIEKIKYEYDMPSNFFNKLIEYKNLLKLYSRDWKYYKQKEFHQAMKKVFKSYGINKVIFNKSEFIKTHEKLQTLSKELIKELKDIRKQNFIVFIIKSKLNYF